MGLPRAPHLCAPALGPNVIVFDPSMPVSQIQATVDAIYAQQVDNEMGTEPLRAPVQAGRLRHAPSSRCRSRSATTPRSPASAPRPTDVTINGKIEVYNRCLDDGGTSNCLALVNFWRTLSNLSINVNSAGPGRLPRVRELLGGLAGRLDAPARRQRRQPLADGLLHRRAAVRQRRLHRRLEACRSSINGSQQQWLTRNSEIARLVQRRLEPGLLRRRGRAVATRRSRTRRTRRSPRRRSAARSRTCSSTPTGGYNVRVPSAQTNTQRHHVGRRRDAGPHASRSPTSSSRSRPTRCRTINNALARGKNLLLTPGVYDIGADASTSSAPTRSCSAWATRRSPPSTARFR